MRSVLAIGLLVALCGSANAATEHHFRAPHHDHLIDRSWAYAPPRGPVHFDDTPSYDDPSKFGGGELPPGGP